MLANSPIQIADLRAHVRLAVDAVLGVTDIVENLHHNILRLPGVLGEASDRPARGITGFVYRSIRGVTRTVGGGIDGVLRVAAPREPQHSPRREALVAALNGLVGDHLRDTSNPLAIRVQLRRDGKALPLQRDALAQALPNATGRIAVFVHGLCMGDLQWSRNDHDHGAALAAASDFTPVYLNYNSGLHISSNGREFAQQLEVLVAAWPVEVSELAIVGYSMGGLLARSACERARVERHAWLSRLRSIVFLGTPHAGSPLERTGNRLDAILGASPYTAALSRLGKMRSAGITDLRHASLSDADWQNRDRFAPQLPPRTSIPLPRGVRCHAIAGSLMRKSDRSGEALVGDGLVPLDSALGIHIDPARHLRLPEARKIVVHGTSHLGLLDSREVHEEILARLQARGTKRHRQRKAARLSGRWSVID